jgi:hypothetical protein
MLTLLTLVPVKAKPLEPATIIFETDVSLTNCTTSPLPVVNVAAPLPVGSVIMLPGNVPETLGGGAPPERVLPLPKPVMD